MIGNKSAHSLAGYVRKGTILNAISRKIRLRRLAMRMLFTML